MNEIERSYHSAIEQWRAGFRAGVERSAKVCESLKIKPMFASNSFPHAESGFNEGVYEAAKAIRSLLNESGAGEKI